MHGTKQYSFLYHHQRPHLKDTKYLAVCNLVPVMFSLTILYCETVAETSLHDGSEIICCLLTNQSL